MLTERYFAEDIDSSMQLWRVYCGGYRSENEPLSTSKQKVAQAPKWVLDGCGSTSLPLDSQRKHLY